MRILAIDPGPIESAALLYETSVLSCDCGFHKPIVRAEILKNESLIQQLKFFDDRQELTVIEMVASFGMAVGKEVFDTCFWIGRFYEAAPITPQLAYRKDIKMHFCNSARAKDSNIRCAILDRFGGKGKAIGLKATPGPFYGLHSHLWSALAIALFAADTQPTPNYEMSFSSAAKP